MSVFGGWKSERNVMGEQDTGYTTVTELCILIAWACFFFFFLPFLAPPSRCPWLAVAIGPALRPPKIVPRCVGRRSSWLHPPGPHSTEAASSIAVGGDSTEAGGYKTCGVPEGAQFWLWLSVPSHIAVIFVGFVTSASPVCVYTRFWEEFTGQL